MTSFISKLYSFIIVCALFFSALLLYQKNTDYFTTKNSSDNLVAKVQSVNEEVATNTDSVSLVSSEPSSTTTLSTVQVPTNVTIEKKVEEIDIPLQKNVSMAEYQNPCVTPVTYKLGRFDTNFGISKSDFLDTVRDATALWNDALNTTIFTYSDTGTITINLIYDSRQAITEQNKYIAAEINNTEAAAIALKKEFDAMEQTFITEKDVYATSVEAFTLKQKTYNETVDMWNKKGGAPKADYDALILQKESLQKEQEVLMQKQQELNTLLAEINKRISRYNELVMYAKSNVTRGNSIARKKFTEGQYNPQSNQIDIYQFTDTIKLHRVLAHEFGHALGLDHNKNTESIMHGINTATSTILSEEDIADLRIICSQN